MLKRRTASTTTASTSTTTASAPAISQLDGGFTLEEVPIGTVTFAADPYEVVSPARLDVPAGGLDGVVLETRAMASISGTVTRNGAPAARAVVSVAQNDRQAVCDGLGVYHLRGLSPGTYTLGQSRSWGTPRRAGPRW